MNINSENMWFFKYCVLFEKQYYVLWMFHIGQLLHIERKKWLQIHKLTQVLPSKTKSHASWMVNWWGPGIYFFPTVGTSDLSLEYGSLPNTFCMRSTEILKIFMLELTWAGVNLTWLKIMFLLNYVFFTFARLKSRVS